MINTVDEKGEAKNVGEEDEFLHPVRFFLVSHPIPRDSVPVERRYTSALPPSEIASLSSILRGSVSSPAQNRAGAGRRALGCI